MWHYLRDVGETSSNNARHLCLYEVVALRRHNGGVDEAKEDGTVHCVHCGIRKVLSNNLREKKKRIQFTGKQHVGTTVFSGNFDLEFGTKGGNLVQNNQGFALS